LFFFRCRRQDILPDTAPPIDRSLERLDDLRELRRVGMAVARAVGRLAEAAAEGLQDEASEDAAGDVKARPAVPAGALSLAFARVSRAVRLSVALEERVEQDAGAPARAAAEAAERARAAVDAEASRRRADVAGVAQDLTETVGELIEDAAFGNETAGDRLYEALVERVEALDDAALQDRPMVELIARICGDLGLEPDWDLWAEADWVEDAGGVRAARVAWKRAAGAGVSSGLLRPSSMLEARPP
jgi:hypothetical protein